MYTHQDYPMWVYKNGEGKIVNDEAENEDAKQDGWGSHADNQKSVDVEKVVRKKKKKASDK